MTDIITTAVDIS